METSKKIQGKYSEFGGRIAKVLEFNKLVKPNGEINIAKAERLCGIKGTGLSKALQANGFHDDNLRKFLGTFDVQEMWLLTGHGDPGSLRLKAKPMSIMETPLT